MADELERGQFEEVYVWVDDIPLSRPRRNIHRDFSDGCMFAEVVQYFVPRLIELHNYIPANSVKQKRLNWDLLWRKVLPKFGIKPTDINTEWVVQAKPGAIEKLLYLLKRKLEETDNRDPNDSDSVQNSLTSPTSDRRGSPGGSQEKLSPEHSPATPQTPHQNPHQNVHQTTSAPSAPLTAEADTSRPAAVSGSGSLIPVKRHSGGRGSSGAARARQAGRTPPAAAAAAAVPAPGSELARLRQQVIEQTEQIAVLTARCRKLQQLLELRDEQLRQLPGTRGQLQ